MKEEICGFYDTIFFSENKFKQNGIIIKSDNKKILKSFEQINKEKQKVENNV